MAWAAPIQTQTTGPDGKTIVTQTTFDTRGNIASRTLPAFAGDPQPTQSMTSDPLGRILITTNPDGSTTRACYNDWITVTVDANGHQRRETRDAFGRIITVDEFTGAVSACSVTPGTPYATRGEKRGEVPISANAEARNVR